MQAFAFMTALLLAASAAARGQGGGQPQSQSPQQSQQGQQQSQPSQPPSAVTIDTTVGGRAAVVESYTLEAEPGGRLRAVAEVGPPGGAKQRTTTLSAGDKPVGFAVEAGGQKIYEAEFATGTVKIRAAGQPERELQTRANVVMENVLWHQFLFLLAQYDRAKAGRQSFVFFSPSNSRDFDIAVERAGTPAYAVGGARLKTEQFKVEAAGLTFDVWLDERGVPLLFDLPAQQLRGVRRGAEEFARAALASAPKPPEYRPPDYADPASFTEREVTVGAATEWALPGTLTLPKGAGPHPAVVLVHGSGPQDRDETLGPNKPFRDLAWGLASRGVAVLRYDKRTRVHGARMVASKARITVKEEAIDDALAAAALLRQTPGVDPKRVFVLGHSLGGGLVPRVALADPQVRGLVVWAGYTREALSEVARQYEYLFSLDGSVTDDERKMIDQAKRDAARLRELKASDAAAGGELLQGIPASYWIDLRDYDVIAAARKVRQPVLVMQGERDYNVTMDAFRDWQKVAAPNFTFKSYPKLDHLFLEGEGPASNADYARPRNVARYVVEDLAAWIKSH
jgi:dienelactone hydrolase